jgi:hypothetical protein
MSLHKQISEQYFLDRSQRVVYEQVTFTQGFQQFLESLEQAKLLKNVERTKTGSTYIWGDSRKFGGVKMETSSHPLTSNNFTSNLVFEGTPEALTQITRLLLVSDVEHL